VGQKCEKKRVIDNLPSIEHCETKIVLIEEEEEE
jgi:hypothetical protein